MRSGAALPIQAPVMATIFFTACAAKVSVLEMTFTSKPPISSLSPKMFHAAAAGRSRGTYEAWCYAIWCQPALWYWLAPAFFEIRCDESSSGSFHFKLNSVDAAKCSGWVCDFLSDQAIWSILIISLSSLGRADRSVTLFLEKPYVCYVTVAGILLFEKAVSF